MAASPQLENGYTRIANELLDAIIIAPLPGRHLRVTLAIVRNTYGWNRKSAVIKSESLCDECGIRHKSAVLKIIRDLIDWNILIAVKNPGKPTEFYINKNHNSWTCELDQRGNLEVTGNSEVTGNNPLVGWGNLEVTPTDNLEVTPTLLKTCTKDMSKDMLLGDSLQTHPLVICYCKLFATSLSGVPLRSANGAAVDLEKHPSYDLELAENCLKTWCKNRYDQWLKDRPENDNTPYPSFKWLSYKITNTLNTGKLPEPIKEKQSASGTTGILKPGKAGNW